MQECLPNSTLHNFGELRRQVDASVIPRVGLGLFLVQRVYPVKAPARGPATVVQAGPGQQRNGQSQFLCAPLQQDSGQAVGASCRSHVKSFQDFQHIAAANAKEPLQCCLCLVNVREFVDCYNSLPQSVVDLPSVKLFQRSLQQALLSFARSGTEDWPKLFSPAIPADVYGRFLLTLTLAAIRLCFPNVIL